jgi:uncharacterized alkaline shock family protein YloU
VKILNGLIGFILSLAILGLGWLLVANVFDVHYSYADVLQSNRMWKLALGASMIALVLLFWLSALPIGKREQFLSFDSEGGMISISVVAVNAFLVKLKSEFAGVVELRSDVSASRDGKVEVRLDMTVKTGTHIQQLSQAMQQRVRDSMRENLGIEDVAIVQVNVQDIVAVDEKDAARQTQRSEWQDNG